MLQEKKILPLNGSEETIAEDMSQHFLNKVSTIRNNLKTSGSTVKLPLPSICSDHAQTVKSITSFRNVSLMELKAYISDLKKKSCECDPIPT